MMKRDPLDKAYNCPCGHGDILLKKERGKFQVLYMACYRHGSRSKTSALAVRGWNRSAALGWKEAGRNA